VAKISFSFNLGFCFNRGQSSSLSIPVNPGSIINSPSTIFLIL
jgi:hypothetical protein